MMHCKRVSVWTAYLSLKICFFVFQQIFLHYSFAPARLGISAVFQRSPPLFERRYLFFTEIRELLVYMRNSTPIIAFADTASQKRSLH